MPQPDGGESQASGLTLVSVAVLARAWKRWIALQPAEMLHVLLAPSGVKAASSGISLQHTQQLVLGSLAFMVVFLHWLTKPTKAAAGIGLANRKPCTVSQPACRNHVGSRVFPHPRLPPPLSFSEDGCTERQKPTAL